MAYGDFKDLAKRKATDKNPKYDGYQRGLSSTVYKFFDLKLLAVVLNLCPKIAELAEELHKPIIRKFKKRKVYSTFKDNI